jgi:hypothetical protein
VNDQFRIISDLVADAEDLLDKVAAAQAPEVRAVAGKLRHSVDLMEDHLRDRLRAAAEQPSFRDEMGGRASPWPYFIGAAVAVALLGWAYSRYRADR